MPRKSRPATPSMMLGPLGGPNSPPHTPTTTAPMANRKLAARHLPQWHHQIILDDSSIQPTGNGHEFSFTPSNRFAHLSPRTSSEDSSESDEEDESESEPESEQRQVPHVRPRTNDEEEDDKDEDSDDEDEDEDSDDEESEDSDDDTPMRFAPPAPAPTPTPVPASVSASMFAPRSVPMPASRMAVDSSSGEESDEEEEDEDEDEESDSDSESESLATPPIQEIHHIVTATTTSTVKANFTLEELSDFDPMDQDRSGTIAPSGFSSPSSARSRSRAPPPKGLPPGFTQEMRNLGFDGSSSEGSDNDLDADEAHREFVRMQRELKMRKRRTHGSSIGKRTISERSDSDHEDMTPLDADDVGSSARRLRRRYGDSHRHSFILFQDPPPPRIDEVEEPESEVEGTLFFCDSGTLARELPYYSIEIMEYESPSPSPSP
ncbi:hypothetical protein CTAM01_07433 [Colletotrichum tamarilloi]|uniref:Uncharacterized protein n=1 Tax=Colletotrichum tamarilloi TaxID=1209934 RepID=A0ABQ9R9D1_9PEZI|nr:uncharacterized protein CTAM01_07433 [Colletotrichum tamarilloi]KAK1498215.1 hypothetical protein CTAM01_07433 [Colletotrichum tamarilloi]